MSSAVTSFVAPHGSHGDAGPSRPVARRTYGRQRAITPTDDDATHSIFVSHPPFESPSKALLGRWHQNSTTWIGSLSALGSSPEKDIQQTTAFASTSPDSRPGLTDFGLIPAQRPPSLEPDADIDDQDASEEAIQLELARMRKEVRGQTSGLKRDALEVPERGAVPLFGSSSLTDLPTSDLSSPPPAESKTSVVDDYAANDSGGTKAISKVALLAAQRRVALRQAESEEEGDITLRRISPSRLSAQSGSNSVSPSPSISRDQNAGDDGNGPPYRGDHDKLNDFWRDIAESHTDDRSDQEDGPSVPRVVAPPIKPLSPVGLFDDNSDTEVAPKKSKKIRPLSKRDTKLMQSGLAEGRRNRQVEVNKIKGDQRPLSQWLNQVEKMMVVNGPRVKEEDPGLSFKKDSSPRTSPSQKTPADPIAAFTPSASEMRDIRPFGSEEVMGGTPSSPTRHIAKPSGANGLPTDEEELRPIETILAADLARRAKEDRLRLLEQRKAAVLKMRSDTKQQAAHRQMLDDEDFEVLPADAERLPKSNSEVKPGRTERPIPNAKAILNRVYTTTSPALSRNQQRILQQAGKLSRAKNSTVTETFAEFAGKTWKHAELKQADGGAKPAERKEGRDVSITKDQLDHMNLQGHNRQSLMLRHKKEQEWNRGSKPLPPKRQHNFAALVVASSSREAQDTDSEGDDDDFVPDVEDGLVDEDGSDEDEEDEQLRYSGEEDEGDELSDAINGEEENGSDREPSASGDDAVDEPRSQSPGTDKENMLAPNKFDKLNTRAQFRNEDATPRASRRPLTDIQPPSPTLRSSTPTLQSTSASLAQRRGEGNDDLLSEGFELDSAGGFSQLFQDTQIDENGDAFAVLRDRGGMALLDRHAVLPGVDLSETQAARDNALVAGELEAARASQLLQSQPKQRYLNDKGYFTQTKPDDYEAGGVETQMANLRKALAGPSDLLSDIMESPQEIILSSTEKDTSSAHPTTSSPMIRTSPVRHRRSSSPALLPRISPKQKRAGENVMQRMMRIAARREKHAAASNAAVKSNWIDNQAEESDEEGGWAPIRSDGSDDEEEGDEEGYIADLVDDQAIDDEERRRQDELAAVKLREVQAADDAKREAEAKKIIQGEHRVKRKGADFFSDDEEDETGGKRRKWSKKERRKRKLEREDGLDKLDGEANVFKEAYDRDLDSDFSDMEPEDIPIAIPVEESLPPARPMYEILRERARIQREKRPDEELDLELGLDDAGFDLPSRQKKRPKVARPILVDTDDESDSVLFEEPEQESQFSISRGLRSAASIHLDQAAPGRRLSAQRTNESYAQYVRDESQVTRRAAGAAGVSVVVQQSVGYTGGAVSRHHANARAPSRQSTTSSSTSGSILMSKGNRFA